MSTRRFRWKASEVLALVLLIAAGFLAWWLLRPQGADDSAESVPLSAPPTAQSAAVPALPPRAVAAPDPQPLGVTEAAAPHATAPHLASLPSGSLVVRVRWSDRTPAAGVGVIVIDWQRSNASELLTHAMTDAAGEARFVHVAAGKVTLQLDRCDGASVQLAPGEEQLVELTIPPCLPIAGRVVDEQGAGIADAIVSLSAYFNYNDWRDLAHTDAHGAFVLRDAGASRYVRARKEGFAASDTHQAYEWYDGDALNIVLYAPCGQVLASVKGPDGAAVAGAEVSLGDSGGWPQRADRSTRIPMGPQRMTGVADDGGRARFGSVPPGRTTLTVRAHGFAPFEKRIDVPALTDTPVQAVLAPGCVVAGRVTDDRGGAVAGAWIGSGGENDSPSMTAVSDESGAYRLEGLPAGTHNISASSEQAGKASADIACRVDQVAEWNPVLASGHSLSGLVLGRGGEPLAGAWVTLSPAKDPSPSTWAFAVTEANGEFRALNVEFEAVDVKISPVPGGPPALVVADQALWTERRVFHVPWSAGAANVVIGRIVGLSLAPDELVNVGVAQPGEPGAVSYGRTERDGRFELRDLADGSFTLSAWLGEQELLDRPLELSGGKVTDLGDLVLEHGGLLVRPTFVGFASAPAPDELSFHVIATDGKRRDVALKAGGGTWGATDLLVGAYDLVIAGEAIGRMRIAVTIAVDKTQELAVDVHAGASVTVRACGAVLAHATSISLCVRDLDGTMLKCGGKLADANGCMDLACVLAAGSYSAELSIDGGVPLTHAFDVSQQPQQQVVSWSVP